MKNELCELASGGTSLEALLRTLDLTKEGPSMRYGLKGRTQNERLAYELKLHEGVDATVR